MPLDLLPARSDSAAGNMATDFLLLKRYPITRHARFRHYDWHRPAVTFGYSQKIQWVRENLAAALTSGGLDYDPEDSLDICRRPTGGGIVDHRNDWTFCLVIPRGYDLEALRAMESYRMIHQALADSLQTCGAPAILKEKCDNQGCDHGPTICFTKPELYDVIHPETGAKIAGAAQKRTKEGLLFQGSIWRPAAGPVNWDAFSECFAQKIASTLQTEALETPWPDLSDEEVSGLTEQYATTEWLEHR